MKITVLTENTSYDPNLLSEHGLSLYIETDNHKILFDMGQSDIFSVNASSLGIDLSKVDIAILSHGHYDHGGGLKKFMEINSTARIYISPFAFEPHYSSNGYIGLDKALESNDRFINVPDILSIDNLTLIPASLLPAPYGIEHYGLKVENGAADSFNHEQYLLIRENNKQILISGCSHKGILNIVDYFNPDILIGGFHFMKINLDSDGINRLNNYAKALMQHTTKYFTCHCTGSSQFDILKHSMGEALKYISTGNILVI